MCDLSFPSIPSGNLFVLAYFGHVNVQGDGIRINDVSTHFGEENNKHQSVLLGRAVIEV